MELKMTITTDRINELCVRAKLLKRTLGLKCAAGFLAKRHVPLEEALRILVPGSLSPRQRFGC